MTTPNTEVDGAAPVGPGFDVTFEGFALKT